MAVGAVPGLVEPPQPLDANVQLLARHFPQIAELRRRDVQSLLSVHGQAAQGAIDVRFRRSNPGGDAAAGEPLAPQIRNALQNPGRRAVGECLGREERSMGLLRSSGAAGA